MIAQDKVLRCPVVKQGTGPSDSRAWLQLHIATGIWKLKRHQLHDIL